jgi:hypothetical protein
MGLMMRGLGLDLGSCAQRRLLLFLAHCCHFEPLPNFLIFLLRSRVVVMNYSEPRGSLGDD